MKRRNFTLLCYLIAAIVLAMMLAPEAKAKLAEMTMMLRVTSGLRSVDPQPVEAAPTPEPSRVALMMIGSAWMILRRRR